MMNDIIEDCFRKVNAECHEFMLEYSPKKQSDLTKFIMIKMTDEQQRFINSMAVKNVKVQNLMVNTLKVILEAKREVGGQ